MDRRELFAELAKFCATGIVAFGASVVYTDYRLAPRNNVSVIPLSIEKITSCDVDESRLDATLKAIDSPPASALQDPYGSYLRAMVKSRSPLTRWIVQERLVPGEFLPRLKDEGILRCSKGGDKAASDLRYNTFLVVQAALIVNQPTAYILRRSCWLRYGNTNIPVSAATDAVPVRMLGDMTIAMAPQTYVFRETGSLILQYDTTRADEIDETTFGQLMVSKSTDVDVQCMVIQPARDDAIDGHGRITGPG